MNGKEIVAEWERRQSAGVYNSYSHSMDNLASMIDAALVAPATTYEPKSYREEQVALREAGFDAYNSDMVDEFPRW